MSVPGAKLGSNVLRETVHPLKGQAHDYDPVLSLVGNASLCLLGEATHGTYEFYRERAEITKRLIKEEVTQRSRSRLTGLTLSESIDTCAVSVTIRMQTKRSVASNDFPPGCGATE